MRRSPLRMVLLVSKVVFYIALTHGAIFLFGSVGQGVDQPNRLPLFIAALLLSVLVERLAPEKQQFVWPAAGLLTILLSLKVLAGGGLSPLGGWMQLLPSKPNDGWNVLLSAIGLTYLWSRGRDLVDLGHQELSASFGRGFVLFLIAVPMLQGLFAAPIGSGAPLRVLLMALLAFFISGLLALALSLLTAQDLSGERGWLAGTLAPVLTLATISLAVLALLSQQIRAALIGLLDLVAAAIYVIIAPIAALVMYLFSGLDPGPLEMPPPATTMGPTVVPEETMTVTPEVFTPPQAVSSFWHIVALLLIVAGIALVLLWATRRARERPDADDEERRSVWAWSDVRQELREMAAGLARLRPRGFGGLRGSDPATRIRRAYGSLLARAAERDRARKVAQTAREYQPTAATLAPEARAEVELLTTLYEQARYGSVATPAQAEAAEQALQTIRSKEEP